MKDNILQMPSSMVLMRGALRGMGRETTCELLLRKQPFPGADRFGTRRYRYTQWTVLHAPIDLPDGEYTITTEDHFRFATTRRQGLWLHGEAQEPEATESETA